MRFIAALWVAIFHFNEPIHYVNNGYRNLAKLGHLGVPIFFVISGYCILMTALSAKSPFDFLARRFFRIYPTYWLSLLIVILAAIMQRLILGSNSIDHIPHNVFSLFATISLYTSPLSNVPTINWVYWSLSCEVGFYVLIIVGLYVRPKNLIYFFLAISVISLLTNAPGNKIYFFFNHWPAFSLGLCIYYFKTTKIIVNKLTLILLTVLNIAGLFRHFYADQTSYIIAAIISGILIYFSDTINVKQSFFSTLGDYSYAVYLIHVPIGVYILGIFKNRLFQENELLNIVFDLGIYCVITFLAALIFKYVEQPCIYFGKLLSQRNKNDSFHVPKSN